MRPIKLTMSAFGPYANKQEIDFEELNGRNIFVISGKTGSGKTTIFDAISYALYGEASGQSREVDSLRSHFADDDIETFVELEFELRGERYLVNRVPKQKRKKARGEGYTEKNADATITLPDGKVITKVKNVTDKLVEILGITKEQFKQIVMLPQGEFKKLLLANSEEREGIFRKIFDTYDFEKVQIELNNKAKDLSKNRNKSKLEMETNLKNIKGEHDIVIDEYVDFPLVIEKLRTLIDKDSDLYKELNEKLKSIEKEQQDKNKEKINIENNNSLLKEKEELLKNLEELLLQENDFIAKEKDINNAKNAKEIKYIEDKLIDSKHKLRLREKDLETNIIDIKKLQENSKLAKEKLNVEEGNEDKRNSLNVEIENLKSIEPKITQFDILKNNIVSLNQGIEKVRLGIKDNKENSEKLKLEKIELEKNLKEISQFETKKVELENDINNKNKAISDIRELFKVITTLEKNKMNHYELAKEYKEFEIKYLDIKKYYENMDDLYKKEQAGILASKLEKDRPCPVCGSTHHPNPTTIKNVGNVLTKEELELKKEELDKLEVIKNEKINELTKTNENTKNYEVFVNDNLSRFSDSLNINKTYNKDTYNEVREAGTKLKQVIEILEKELIKVNQQINLKEKLSETITNIENNLVNNEKQLNSLNEEEKVYITNITQTNTDIERYKKEIPESIKDINSLKEILNIKIKELNDSKQRLINLRNENENIAKLLEGKNSTANEIRKSIELLNLDINKIVNEFDEAIKDKNFEELAMYESAKLNIHLIENLEDEVAKYKNNISILSSKKEDIINKTKDLNIIDIATINEEIEVIIENKGVIEKEIKEIYSIIDSNKHTLKNVEKLNEQFKEIEEEYKIVGELADLANGKKSPYISFERYILASYFEDIIDAANIRLQKMTGERFTLIRKKTKSKGAGQKGLELEIYDNYTDSSRDVSSLSGGESFKASLSLALGLSDVVQSSSGGVVLDTMFVDEGFGTLDPQSLDNAIDSLLELQRGGRLVGIISHVEELKERIDAKLEVVSTSNGSKAKFNIL